MLLQQAPHDGSKRDDTRSKPDSSEVSVQLSNDSIRTTSSIKDESSPVEAMVEKHVYQEISSSEVTVLVLLILLRMW